MRNITYISNLSLKTVSGGWGSINFNIYSQLSKYFNTTYNGPINPPSDYFKKIPSKIFRSVGLRGNYHFFSERRLKNISGAVRNIIPKDSDYFFFFGSTPWIKFKPKKDYGVYIDACFKTYIDIYLNKAEFSDKDIKRIAEQEAEWLSDATHILGGSKWALNETVRHYGISNKNMFPIWVGGNADIPDKDLYDGGKDILFISLDFLNKGGLVCYEVVKRLRTDYPELKLKIIGQKPPKEILDENWVNYVGLLDKSKALDRRIFNETLSKAFLLIHPTKMDTMGLIFLEAGYHGCPSIGTNNFGIPEMIIDGKTGFTINNPFEINDIVDKVGFLLSNDNLYKNMRKDVHVFTKGERSWDVIGKYLYNIFQKKDR